MKVKTVSGEEYKINDFSEIRNPEEVIELDCSFYNLTTLEPIRELINLKKLHCSKNQIETLEPIRELTNLQELYCSSNQIDTLEPIRELINLQYLVCSNNQIETLEPISNLTNLQKLCCSENQIETLVPIRELTNLIELYCSSNQIDTLEPIRELINLQKLDCFDNQIETLEPISNLINLQKLYCFNNQIITLEPINNLINLERLWCNNNRLTSLPLFLTNFRNLTYFIYCNNNEIEYIPRPIQRLIRRLENRYYNRNIYTDGQNVHNHHIQDCIRTSIHNLLEYETKMKEETLKSEILEDNILEETTKRVLLEYIENKDEHTVIGCTFEDLLIQVWSIIKEHPESTEIKRILDQEMSDSLCKCFTGRLSRLVNVLNGYSDLVSITISDSEQKNMIMSIGIRTYDNREELEEYIRNEFEERGFDDTEDWLGYLDEL